MSFVKAIWKDIIRSGFFYQMNPLIVSYKPIVVFIYPSSYGKVNNLIIQKLYEFKNILHNHKTETVSISFDGDNAYKNLNQSFYESLINRMIKQNIIPFGRMLSLRISPDYSQIIKRLRYRILSHIVHMEFAINSPVIDINEIQHILKSIPSVVFSDTPLANMHDILPITIFSLANFVELFEKKMFYASAFGFPISITITAKNAETIGYKNRMFLFQTALWFLVLFKKFFDDFKTTGETEILNERKYNNNVDVVPYTTDLLIEFTNCLYSNISLMKKKIKTSI